MQTLMIDPAVPMPIGATRFNLVLVGCGGTGSYTAQSIARLMAHCQATSGPAIHALFVDGDTVEVKNVGRQLFSRAEVGRNKAQTLTTRFNAALGLQIEAIPRMADADLLCNQQLPGMSGGIGERRSTYNILIGAVDTHVARMALARSLKHGNYDMWIDSGNHETAGQVVVGTRSSRNDLLGSFGLGGICTSLPSPSMLYPRLLRKAAVKVRQDCAAAVEDNRQSLMINEQMATIVGQYLYQICIKRQITTYETEIDLQSFSMRSTTITARNIAKAMKLDLEFLTYLKGKVAA